MVSRGESILPVSFSTESHDFVFHLYQGIVPVFKLFRETSAVSVQQRVNAPRVVWRVMTPRIVQSDYSKKTIRRKLQNYSQPLKQQISKRSSIKILKGF
jgi:hypothetical protein